jgi:hypothetical protein
MYSRFLQHGFVSVLTLGVLFLGAPSFSQGDEHQRLGPPLRPMVKMIGFVNANIEKTETRPVLTFALPADEKRYTFLLTDMKILAGPLRTPGDILSDVKPYSTNFYLRTSQEIAAQISSAAPTEQLAIVAEYHQGDRVLYVQGVEKEGGLPDK